METETQETQETEPEQQPTPQIGWLRFHGKPVMLQLRDGSPYMGVLPNYQFAQTQDGGVKATPMLSGILFVEPNGAGGALLVIQAPTGPTNTVLITVHPNDVLYCTHHVQSLIVTQ